MQRLQNRYVFVRNIADMVALCLTWNSTVLLKTSPIAEGKKRGEETHRGCNKTNLDGSVSSCGHCEYSGNRGRHFHASALLRRWLSCVNELYAVCNIVVNMSKILIIAILWHLACVFAALIPLYEFCLGDKNDRLIVCMSYPCYCIGMVAMYIYFKSSCIILIAPRSHLCLPLHVFSFPSPSLFFSAGYFSWFIVICVSAAACCHCVFVRE